MSEARASNILVDYEDMKKTRELLKAYPAMKASIAIFADQIQGELNEFDLANAEGRGTRGDIDGRGKIGDIVGNTAVLREERPTLILEYEKKCNAIDKAMNAIPRNQSEILMKCYFEQKKDKDIYDFILGMPKTTYDLHKKSAITTIAFILKSSQII